MKALLLSSITGQALAFLLWPLLTRLYEPSAVGLFGTVSAALSLLAAFSHGRYHLAIPLCDGRTECIALFRIAILLSVLTSSIFSSLNYFYQSKTSSVAEDGSMIVLFSILLVGILNSIFEATNFLRARHGNIETIAKIRLLRTLYVGTFQIAFYFAGAVGLVAGLALGSLLGTLHSVAVLPYISAIYKDRTEKRTLLKTMKKWKDYPLKSVPQGFVGSASWNFLPSLLLWTHDQEIVGQYWLAYRIAIAPIAIVGSAYRQVYLRAFRSETGQPNKSGFFLATKHTAIALVASGLAVSVGYLAVNMAFSVAFGTQWEYSAVLCSALIFSWIGDLTKIPYQCHAAAAFRHTLLLNWEIFSMITKFAIFIFLNGAYSLPVAILGFSVSSSLSWLMFSAFYASSTRNQYLKNENI